MSETEHYKGYLALLDVTDIEEWAKEKLKGFDIPPDDDYESFVEQLEDMIEQYEEIGKANTA